MAYKLHGNRDWMSHLPDELLDVSLWNLAIPGSHDSMSFCLDLSSPVVESESWFLKAMDRLAPSLIRPCVFRWATTQQAVLSHQCDLGIRFLDLRIARKPKEGSKLFFAHGIYTWISVKEALDEVATWLDQHPKEVLIVCCSHFTGLTRSDHRQLVDDIISRFGPKLCSAQDCPTLRSCWAKRQQVRRQPRSKQGPFLLGGSEEKRKTSCFLRQWPEPDGKRCLCPPPSLPKHEEHHHQSAGRAARLGARATAGTAGGRRQHHLRRLC
ncbi:PI-PLC X domain-containing protein 1-like isoform X3 [Vanacampus margaritifer]